MFQKLEDILPRSVMDVPPSRLQLHRLASLAEAVGPDVADGKLRCFAGIGLPDAARRLSAREASSFILLLQTLREVA